MRLGGNARSESEERSRYQSANGEHGFLGTGKVLKRLRRRDVLVYTLLRFGSVKSYISSTETWTSKV